MKPIVGQDEDNGKEQSPWLGGGDPMSWEAGEQDAFAQGCYVCREKLAFQVEGFEQLVKR